MNEQNKGTNMRPTELNRPHTCLCGLAETPVKTHTQGQVFITLQHKAAAIQNATAQQQQNQTKNLKHEIYTCINMKVPTPCNYLPGPFSAVHSIFFPKSDSIPLFHHCETNHHAFSIIPHPPPTISFS